MDTKQFEEEFEVLNKRRQELANQILLSHPEYRDVNARCEVLESTIAFIKEGAKEKPKPKTRQSRRKQEREEETPLGEGS